MHLVKHPKCALKSSLYCFSAFQHINRSGVKGGERFLNTQAQNHQAGILCNVQWASAAFLKPWSLCSHLRIGLKSHSAPRASRLQVLSQKAASRMNIRQEDSHKPERWWTETLRSSDSSAAKSRTYLDLNAPADSISTLEGTLPIFACFFFFFALFECVLRGSETFNVASWFEWFQWSVECSFLTGATRSLPLSAVNHRLCRNAECV